MNKLYKIRYLPLFAQDLTDTANYISNVLRNPQAASKLVDDVEKAILTRSENPLSFEPYHSERERGDTYYRIYVGNYIIFYAVVDDVMEVRRLLYNARNIKKYI